MKQGEIKKFETLLEEGERTQRDGNERLVVKAEYLDQTDVNGLSLLDWAFIKGYQEILNIFYKIVLKEKYFYVINNKIDTLKTDSKERSILHWAILCYQPSETIDFLITEGANVNALTDKRQNALHLAAARGQIETVQVLMSKIIDINARGTCGETALMLAVLNNHKNVVDFLLSNNALMSTPLTGSNDYHKKFNVVAGDTPLHAAIKLGHKEIVQSLLMKGVNVEDRTHQGHNALRLAAESGQVEIVQLLLDHRVDINAHDGNGVTALLLAIENNHPNVVKLLLEKGADTSIAITHRDEYQRKFPIRTGDTPLNIAIILGHKDMVQDLLSKGASVNVSIGGLNALTLAALHNHPEIVELLVSHGININTRTDFGATALLIAVENNHKDVIDVLLRLGADPSISLQTSNTYHIKFNVEAEDTPLHAAIKLGHIDAVQSLLNKGANPDILGAKGHNALSLAAEKGRVEIVELLINHGANINARSEMGATALLIAIEHKHKNVVDLLLSSAIEHVFFPLQKSSPYHNKFNVVAYDTPLHAAIKMGDKDILEALLVRYHSVNNIQNSLGETPLHCAVKSRNIEMVELLLNAGAQVYVKDVAGNTPIRMAIQNEDEAIANALIRRSARSNEHDSLLINDDNRLEQRQNLIKNMFDYEKKLMNKVARSFHRTKRIAQLNYLRLFIAVATEGKSNECIENDKSILNKSKKLKSMYETYHFKK